MTATGHMFGDEETYKYSLYRYMGLNEWKEHSAHWHEAQEVGMTSEEEGFTLKN